MSAGSTFVPLRSPNAGDPAPREARRVALQGAHPTALMAAFSGATIAEARKIASVVNRGGDLAAPVTGVRRVTLEAVRAGGHVPTLAIQAERHSRADPFRKWVLAGSDGAPFETVRIPLERAGRFSVCVSSQVGCALACAFCATGRLGLRRNLETWEIIEQVRVVRASLSPGEKIHGVVFQGMGEPLANVDRVLDAIDVLREPSGLSIDARAMTVCTAGIPASIRRLACDARNVRLGISIGSARPEVRRALMPIDRAHSLDDVLDAAVFHAEKTRLAPMWALTLLARVNDTDDDARALAVRYHAFTALAGLRPRLSIIPYNAIGGSDPFSRSSDDRERSFRDLLAHLGVFSHKRYSGGADVDAACGQLAGRAEPSAPG
jgi:23S rRNA (adenine2503-C2)-methyltransferase